MVVEDDQLIGEMLTLKLNLAEYRVTLATPGEQAQSRLFEVMPALILLDVGLPDMSGFDVLAKVRKHRAFLNLPVIVLTARHAADDVKRAISLGANDYIAKPFEMSRLMKRIERALSATPPPRATQRRDDRFLI